MARWREEPEATRHKEAKQSQRHTRNNATATATAELLKTRMPQHTARAPPHRTDPGTRPKAPPPKAQIRLFSIEKDIPFYTPSTEP
eukprot:CAMPEP_0206213486 /NCGR_PEP_ID=MMETSP0047_2-20121206/1151_1 /ASSEMBLY_ACC=CAM_ASM_000192 /TAXON_ID=195065 /ORGANISM="Chroomonas mesostigmatica_cf, Strain CCMP1168" /LENGTH=85 /DNA_ID=CAMNT_0053635645 /DNA_START=113 /DNA_END=367 /DNA_ORIENTATION=-